MSAWRYIPGRWWIFAIPNTVFLVVGIALLIAHANGLRAPDTWFPMDEILFLGIFFILFPPLYSVLLYLRIRKGNSVEKDILRNGIRTDGKLLSMVETGKTVNNSPEIEMELLLDLPGGGTRKITHRCFISIINLAAMSTGDRLPVIIDPAHPGRMIVLDKDQN